jgi:preprotein translocase subunit YajC/putative salt-induced outer membrane protein YdiY
MLSKTGRVTASFIFMFLTTAAVASAAATDVVTTITGEKIVGEIKKVEKDVLTIETAYSDSDFKVKWDQIASIDSDRQFLVETFSGNRLSGQLKTEVGKSATVLVANVSVPLAEVSAMDPYERSFWSRINAGFDFGYSVTQANSAKQLTFGGNLLYRDKQIVDSMLVNMFKSTQSNAPDTQRWDFGNDFRYLFGNRWYANTTQDFTNSDEQGLDLRTTLGVGGGRYLLRSSSQHLGVGGGLAWTKEAYQDPAIPKKDSAEAYLGTEFMTEKLKITDVVTRFTYYPSLTIDDRYRINFRFDLDFNLPGDWYFRSGVFDNYDSKPPSGLSKNDFGWSNSFGLKF